MAFNSEFPYTDSKKYNDDWLIMTVKKLIEQLAEFVNLNKIKYANPILWDITSQYEVNTIVIDPQTGDAYISVDAVPRGVALSNTDYWTKIYNYSNSINTLEEQIAAANEELSTTATAPRSVGDLVWLNGLLYQVTAPMIAGDSYVIDSNCKKVTIELIINTIVGSLDDLQTEDKTNLVAAINSVLTMEATVIGALDNLQTEDKTNLVAAINEVLNVLTSTAGSLDDLQTEDKTNLVTAINEVLATIDDKLADYEKASFGELEIKRYYESGFVVDIIKIPYEKANGQKNVPVIVGENTLDNMVNYAVNTKVASNIGYYDVTQDKSVCTMVSQGVKHTGDIIDDPATIYLAISDTGELKAYPYNEDIDALIAQGYHNIAGCRCQLIKNGIADPDNPLTRFMQQIIAVDTSNNYFLVTTSYYCNMTSSQQIAWLISHIPNIKNAFALDSGGSAQTIMCGIRTNLESDITSDGLGRKVAGALVFPIDDVSDANTLASTLLRNSNKNIKKLVDTGNNDIAVGVGVYASNCTIYQEGNHVFGNMILYTTSDYDGSWTPLTYFNDKLPKTDAQFTEVGAQSAFENPWLCQIRMQLNTSQTSQASNLEFHANTASSAVYYYANIDYVTRQNM